VSLSLQVKQEIDHWLAKFPPDQAQSAVLAALKAVQEDNPDRCLTEASMNAVAEYLRMPPIAVYEVASFYSMYEHQPVGKYKVCVCMSISCHLNNTTQLLAHIKTRLGIDVGETTVDKKFTLKKVGCLGACVGGPAIQINETYHEHMTPEKFDALVASLE
jgi:NADH-quinone oxidoreductase subunit E